MKSDGRWVLIVGYGSIGRRHFQNAQRLGWADVRLLRTSSARAGAFGTPPGTRVYADLEAALADEPFAAIVANPSSLHSTTACRLLRARVPVLLEKPVSATMEGARDVAASATQAGVPCSVAYCFRYHPLYRALHDIVHTGRLGRVFHAGTWWAGYLPSWHPWEDFRTSYAARTDLGGGVVRTLDHEMDMLRWMLGQPQSVLASAGSLGGLGLEVEDTADMIFRFADGVQAHSHVSFARRDLSRGMTLTGEKASVTLDWNAGCVIVADDKAVIEREMIPPDYELNHMYADMLDDTLRGFAAEPPRASVPLENGIAALEMALAALEASGTGSRVTLAGVGHVEN